MGSYQGFSLLVLQASMDARIIRSLVTADKAILAISGHYCGLDQFIAHVRRTATIRTDHGVACPVQTSGISPFFRPGQTKDCQASRSWIRRTLSEWISRHYWHGWARYAVRLTACLPHLGALQAERRCDRL